MCLCEFLFFFDHSHFHIPHTFSQFYLPLSSLSSSPSPLLVHPSLSFPSLPSLFLISSFSFLISSFLLLSYFSSFTGASKVEVEALRAQVEECEGRLEKGAEYVDVLQAQIDEMTEEISNMKRAEEVCSFFYLFYLIYYFHSILSLSYFLDYLLIYLLIYILIYLFINHLTN